MTLKKWRMKMLEDNNHKLKPSRFNRIKALIKKESYQIIKDPSSILIAFIFPMVLLFIYGVGVSLDMNNLKIGVVLEENNSDTLSFYNSIKNSKYIIASVAKNQKEFESQITAGELRGIVNVPFYFSQFLRRYPDKVAPIYVISDGSETNTAHFVKNYIMGCWLKWRTQNYINSGAPAGGKINMQQRVWYNEELNSRHFLIPGSIAIIMTLIGTLLTALVVAREWERGTIEALMATPVTMREIYISKTIAYFLLGMFSMVLCTIISRFVFLVPFRGSFIALLVVSATFLLTALGTGLFISTKTKNQFLASQIAIVSAFLPAFMLSGFIFEISSMPFIIRCITYLVPARYMVSCLKTLFLVGNAWGLLITNVVIMAVIIVILFTVLFRNKTKRLDV
jgi:ABC-2 type transport system permease protein